MASSFFLRFLFVGHLKSSSSVSVCAVLHNRKLVFARMRFVLFNWRLFLLERKCWALRIYQSLWSNAKITLRMLAVCIQNNFIWDWLHGPTKKSAAKKDHTFKTEKGFTAAEKTYSQHFTYHIFSCDALHWRLVRTMYHIQRPASKAIISRIMITITVIITYD